MRAGQFGVEHVLAFEPDERVLETLKQYLSDHGISAGRFVGIGGLSEATIQYWNAETKQYEKREFQQQFEVINLTGNIALNDGQPYVHPHITLGAADYRTYAGHLGEGVVYPTLELFITQLNGTLERRKDEQTGLTVLHPEAGAKSA